MPIVNVKVIENFFSTEQKNALIGALTDAFCAATFEAARPYIYVVIEEVPQGQWGLGGVRLPNPDFLVNDFAPMIEKAAVLLSQAYNVPIRPRQPQPESDQTQVPR